jgi:hypothetical protein
MESIMTDICKAKITFGTETFHCDQLENHIGIHKASGESPGWHEIIWISPTSEIGYFSPC